MNTGLIADFEFALVAATTARPQAPFHRAMIDRAITGKAIDWLRFLALVERHRVASLVFDSLTRLHKAIPEFAYTALRFNALRDRTRSLQLTGVLATVTARLDEAGVESVSIKGPTLSSLAFGDPSLRQMRDLDLLIARDTLATALVALKEMGCRLVLPQGFAPKQLELWTRFMKDVTVQHQPSGALIELHWRLDNNPHLVPVSITQSRQIVMIGEMAVSTLDQEDLLLYLCLHGAKHSWFRLKWLADMYALLATFGTDKLIAFCTCARAKGLAIPAQQMFLLLNEVYGLVLPEALNADAKRCWRTRRLKREALRLLLMVEEPDEHRFGTTSMSIQRLWLRHGLRYAKRDLGEMLIDWPTVIRLGGTRRAYVTATLGRVFFWSKRKLLNYGRRSLSRNATPP